MIHLVHQIEALGPSFLHEMWSYERFMSVLSQYMHNRAYPKGSMIEVTVLKKSSSAVKST